MFFKTIIISSLDNDYRTVRALPCIEFHSHFRFTNEFCIKIFYQPHFMRKILNHIFENDRNKLKPDQEELRGDWILVIFATIQSRTFAFSSAV
jgi:hypothetical protein